MKIKDGTGLATVSCRKGREKLHRTKGTVKGFWLISQGFTAVEHQDSAVAPQCLQGHQNPGMLKSKSAVPHPWTQPTVEHGEL